MKSDKPFRVSLITAVVLALILVIFPKGSRGAGDFHALPVYLAVAVVAALITGTWVYFHKDSWSWSRIAICCIGNALWIAVAITLVLFAH
jgi:hypothetical protein